MIIIRNENDYQYQYVADSATKKCIGALIIYVYDQLYINNMTADKISTLLPDVSIEGDIVEKDTIVIDAKINGDVKSENVETHPNSNIKGNIKSKFVSLGGKITGNVNSDQISIKKTADVDGVLNQKTLSIEEGATLKIKTQTYK